MCDVKIYTHFFKGNSVALAFNLRFWAKIKQLLSNCPDSDLTFQRFKDDCTSGDDNDSYDMIFGIFRCLFYKTI